MSSATLLVKALAKDGALVTVELVMAHPDSRRFCFERNCALQILWDRANPRVYGRSPLGDEVTVDDILEPAWLVANAERFIESVELVTTTNYPLEDGITAGDFPLENRPTAVVTIRVTDAKWVAHFAIGDDWQAAPFDATAY